MNKIKTSNQCRWVKDDGQQCENKTRRFSKLCHLHDPGFKIASKNTLIGAILGAIFSLLAVIIYDGIPKSFGFHEESGAIAISPDRFVEDLSVRFDAFADELRNENNRELRTHFESRFDDDNTWGPR